MKGELWMPRLLSASTNSRILRARFSLSHEVGHVVLHPGELIRLSRIPHREAALARGASAPYPVYQDTEWQANAFSAALLMPAQGLYALEQQGVLTSVTIQERFQVSSAAAAIRLKNYQQRSHELLAGGNI